MFMLLKYKMRRGPWTKSGHVDLLIILENTHFISFELSKQKLHGTADHDLRVRLGYVPHQGSN